jgi:hypothetical protein
LGASRTQGISRYHHARNEPDFCRQYASWSRASIVGVYENPSPEPSVVVLTDEGLLWGTENALQSAAFASIRSVHGTQDKAAGTDISLEMQDGTIRSLSIYGAEGKDRDVFSMVRFLMRVIESPA